MCKLIVCSATGLAALEALITSLYSPPSARPLHTTKKNSESPGYRNKMSGK